MPIFPRAKEYIGREQQQQRLRQWTTTTDQDRSRCYALYFEGAGGLGKTYLLEQYFRIIRTDSALATSLRVGRIADMYYFQNRSPITLEQHLIRGLTSSQGDPGLPDQQIKEAFRPYQRLLEQYERTREYASVDAREQEQELHRVFIECWNELAQSYLLVMRFDTVETLFVAEDDPRALINTSESRTGARRIMEWMRDVLPKLRHTLALISGRPSSLPHNPLQEYLRDILAESVIRLDPLRYPDEIAAYLRASGYQLKDTDPGLQDIAALTDGRPLLLTCYVGMLRNKVFRKLLGPDTPLPAGLMPQRSQQDRRVSNRQSFEDLLIGTILSPLEYLGTDMGVFTLTCCLYFLAYARRGIKRKDLRRLFDALGLGSAYDPTIIDQLEHEALVKIVRPMPGPNEQVREASSKAPEPSASSEEDILICHDQIFELIDRSSYSEALGLRNPTQDFLCEVGRQDVREQDAARNLPERQRALLDHLYYELTRDLDLGYRTYTIYVDWMLRERLPDVALLLADVFWGTLKSQALRGSMPAHLLDGSGATAWGLTRDIILRDDQVRQIKLLLSFGKKPAEIAEQAHKLYEHLATEGVLPARLAWQTNRPKDADSYLFASLVCEWANALTLANVPGRQPQLKRLFEAGHDFLDAEKDSKDQLLRLRRQFFLGQLYTLRGQMLRQQQRYRQARKDALAGRAAFLTYRDEPSAHPHDQEQPAEDNLSPKRTSAADSLNDNIRADLAQVTNNLAYSLAESGDLTEALKLSDEVLDDYLPYVSDYRRALFLNTRILIIVRHGPQRLREAQSLVGQATSAAWSSGNARARGLVALATGQLERALMNQRNHEPEPNIEEYYAEAGRLLSDQKSDLREVYQEWAKFVRDRAELYQRQGKLGQARVEREQALGYLKQALEQLPETQEAAMQRADLHEARATIYNLLEEFEKAREELNEVERLLRTPPPMPEYSQVVCGKVALQRAYQALRVARAYQAALDEMALALARAYLFAPEHREQAVFQRLIRRWIADLVPREELVAFRRAHRHGQRTVSVNDLPYRRPGAKAWRLAWERAVTFVGSEAAISSPTKSDAKTVVNR